MAVTDISEVQVADAAPTKPRSTWRNISLYVLRRTALLFVTVVTAVYLTIIIANFGGYVDTLIASRVEESVGFMMMGEWNRDLPPDERMAAAEELIVVMKDAAGLNDPFLLRTFFWLGDALTLNWGEPEQGGRTYQLSESDLEVREIILENLSRTLVVFGLSNVLLFGFAVWFALVLSRRHGGRLDRLVILLSPISSAPAWVLGVLLSVFLLRVFGFSPGGTLDSWPGDGNFQLNYLLVVLRHLALPFAAVFLSGFFQSAYIWRSFFQVYRNEDYVVLAQAKGLGNGRIDRNYIIRPALPALLTSFALLLAVLWQEMIALEAFFNVQGLGRLFFQALNTYDTPMIVAIVTTFAYMIAIIVFVLDICYILVDPRVRVGSQNQERQTMATWNSRFWQRRKRLPQLQPLPKSSQSRKSQIKPRKPFGGLVRFGRETGYVARNLWQNPSAIFGVLIIVTLLGVSVYTVTTIPYQEAISLWRGDDYVWLRTPRNALPTWVNNFRLHDLPPSLTLSSAAGDVPKEIVALEGNLTDIIIPFTFEYDYGDFPQELILDIEAQFEEKGPHLTVTWVWPDGSERELSSFQSKLSDSYFVGRDDRLQRRLRTDFPQEALFLGPEGEATEPQAGTYTMRVQALHFEPEADIDVTFTLLGQVHGLAGTDSQRRDLMIALLWGTPIALSFGLVAAFATSAGMMIAALGAWFGGAVDRTVQFLTEVNLILPFFPVALMVFVLYSRSILTILAVTAALTLFGSAVKTYRAAFLQIRSEPYIQAAQVYGASNWRIVVRYMVPRIVTVLVPKLIILVPSFVFLEATLAFLGIIDPHLPTWGKLVVAALSYGVYSNNSSHLVIFPLALLFLTGFAFAMVGIALERIFDPRLRER